MPHASVHPIRPRYRDHDLQTTVSYRAGFVAECSCGYVGSFRRSYDQARRDREAHAETHKP